MAFAALTLAGCSKDDDPAPVTGITLNQTAKTLRPGDTFQLHVAEVLPSNADDKTITWSSSDTDAVTVDQTGLVSVSANAAEGTTATVTATAGDGRGAKATCVIIIASDKVTNITLNATAKILHQGDTFQLSVEEILPADADDKTVTWSSSDTGVATVDQTGLVTVSDTDVYNHETVTITATAGDGGGAKATCVIIIVSKVTDIRLNVEDIRLRPGNKFQLNVEKILPEDADDKTILWSSSDTQIATVDHKGLVTVSGNAPYDATATITATAGDDGGAKATCALKVLRSVPADGVLINGLIWAKTNVDAPGTFAANPEDAGMFYQGNRKTGWSATDPRTSSPAGQIWDSTIARGDSWAAANDPCPEGWRLPTEEELKKLLDADNVGNEWITRNGVNGREFTDNSTGNTIFFPAAGKRDPDAQLRELGYSGKYWTSNFYSDWIACHLLFDSTIVKDTRSQLSFGFSVRCILKE